MKNDKIYNDNFAENFFKNYYKDRGMLKWQGFFLSDHKKALNHDFDSKKN